MSLQGIDISNWQRGINLSAVPCDFVIVKATEGTGYTSPSFKDQVTQTIETGKLLGIYHYADGTDAIAEADHFIKKVMPYVGRAILFLDWESENNKTWNKTTDRAWISAWLQRVQEKTGVKPMIYIQKSAMQRVHGLGDYGLWVAQYANNNPTGYQENPWNEGAYNCVLRQYTSAGKLSGYGAKLDLDKFYGDADTWERFARKANTTLKPIEEVAKEVIESKWGDGAERKERLEKAGYDYTVVQIKVNELLRLKESKKSIDEVAREVIAGLWGNGLVRKAKLAAHGYNPATIQKRVNELL